MLTGVARGQRQRAGGAAHRRRAGPGRVVRRRDRPAGPGESGRRGGGGRHPGRGPLPHRPMAPTRTTLCRLHHDPGEHDDHHHSPARRAGYRRAGRQPGGGTAVAGPPLEWCRPQGTRPPPGSPRSTGAPSAPPRAPSSWSALLRCGHRRRADPTRPRQPSRPALWSRVTLTHPKGGSHRGRQGRRCPNPVHVSTGVPRAQPESSSATLPRFTATGASALSD